MKIAAPEHVTQAILRRYMDKGNVDEVNYADFCEDVDGATALFGVGQENNHSFDYFPKTRPRVSQAEIVRNNPADVEDVMARIRLVASKQRIRVSELFKLLTEFYKAPKEGEPMLWKSFSDSVDNVFTKKELEKSVDIKLDDTRTLTNYGRRQPTEAERTVVQEIVEQF